MGITIATLACFVLVGLLPKVPWWAKLLVQVVVGAGIYLFLAEHEFPLPSPDTNPIGASLYGGNIAKAWGMDDAPALAFLSMGVIGPVLGFLSTAAGTLLWYLVDKKKEG
jgi:hypothetical protein